MELSIHIHEDAWGMRNLYPLEALPDASTDIREAAEASLRNGDGIGWADVHLINEPSIDYSTMALSSTDAASALEPFMPRVRRFTATRDRGL